jgi:hypothetical protein
MKLRLDLSQRKWVHGVILCYIIQTRIKVFGFKFGGNSKGGQPIGGFGKDFNHRNDLLNPGHQDLVKLGK